LNTAIFSVINAALSRLLPYPNADNLIVLREHSHTFWQLLLHELARLARRSESFTEPRR
jgi:hypothetical protein